MTEQTKTPVSPKVTAASITAAATVLVLYVLDQVAFIAAMPEVPKAALGLIITGVVTYVAGYLKTDPLRSLIARGAGEHRAS